MGLDVDLDEFVYRQGASRRQRKDLVVLLSAAGFAPALAHAIPRARRKDTLNALVDALLEPIKDGDGDSFVSSTTAGSNVQVDGSVLKAGVKYVTGDITLAMGVTSGESKDGDFGSIGTTDDSSDSTSASVTYAVASGVSAVVGYTTVDTNNEGISTTDGGSAWYVGATMSF